MILHGWLLNAETPVCLYIRVIFELFWKKLLLYETFLTYSLFIVSPPVGIWIHIHNYCFYKDTPIFEGHALEHRHLLYMKANMYITCSGIFDWYILSYQWFGRHLLVNLVILERSLTCSFCDHNKEPVCPFFYISRQHLKKLSLKKKIIII